MEHYERIRKRREELGLTQKEVADKIFVKHNTYSQYETGKRKIDSETFFSIIEILEMKSETFEKNHEEKIERLLRTEPITKFSSRYGLVRELEKNKYTFKIVIKTLNMKTIHEKHPWIISHNITKNTTEILNQTFPNDFIAVTWLEEYSIFTNNHYKEDFFNELQTKLDEIHPEISFSISHTTIENRGDTNGTL